MSKDEKQDGKEYTFIKEHILPRRKNRLKKICISLGATVVLGVLFGVIARVAFVMSEPMINKLLGIDNNKKQVTFSSGEEDLDDVNNDLQTEDNQVGTLPSKDTTEENETDSNGDDNNTEEDSQTVNNTYYVQNKVTATVKDFVNIYSDMKKIANEAQESIVTVKGMSESVDMLKNPYLIEQKTPGLVVANNDVEYLILTSYTDVKDATDLEVTFTGNVSVQAQLEAYDKGTDFAVLSVQLSELTPYIMKETVVAELGESYLLTNGTPVIALGAPNGVNNSFDFGMITNASSVEYITDRRLDIFYTSIPSGKNARGYVVNLDGAIVGIITNSENHGNTDVCTIIGISRVKKLIEKLVNGEERTYFGIVAEDMPAEALEDAGVHYGIYVTEVISKSPAFEAGIQCGDIIVSLNDSPVGGVNTFVNIMDGISYKDEVRVGIVRYAGDSVKDLDVYLSVGRMK